MNTYDQFFIPYQSTLELIPDEVDQITAAENTQNPIQGLCVKTVRIVRAILDKVLEQFPEVGPALAAAFTAYDNGALKIDLDTGQILAT